MLKIIVFLHGKIIRYRLFQLIRKQIIGQRVVGDGQSAFDRSGIKYARYDTSNDFDVFDFDLSG